MDRIPQRELRNNVSSVLRRAEAGERLLVTVDGRPVAELGPARRSRPLASSSVLRAILAATPVDADWPGELDHLRGEEREQAEDPWAS